jgi:hypothetical protein
MPAVDKIVKRTVNDSNVSTPGRTRHSLHTPRHWHSNMAAVHRAALLTRLLAAHRTDTIHSVKSCRTRRYYTYMQQL